MPSHSTAHYFLERMAGLAIDPVGNTSEAFARIIAADIASWSAVAKAAHIKAD
jgi:hypothetical protein